MEDEESLYSRGGDESPVDAKNNDTNIQQQSNAPSEEINEGPAVSWEASEYIHNQKNIGWYAVLGVVTLALSAIFWLLIDWFSGLMILLVGASFGVYAAKQPQVRRYSVSTSSLTIDKKHYPISEFKSFTAGIEGAVTNIVFMPLKRFSPSITIYASPKDGQDAVRLLESVLPREESTPDVIDRFMRNIRF